MTKEQQIAFRVTSWFENGDGDPYTGITGNFDGQGISFGPNQYCLGQGSLQPLLGKMAFKYAVTLKSVFAGIGDLGNMEAEFKRLLVMETPEEQVKFVADYWHFNKQLSPAWAKFFKALGTTSEMHAIFDEAGAGIAASAEELATWIAKEDQRTIRVFCLAYDIATQNGGVGSGLRLALAAARPFLRQFYRSKLEKQGKNVGKTWMEVVAGCRALQTRILGQRQFFLDVCARKFMIIDGSGKFRGEFIDLDKKFGVSDEVY